MDSATIRAIAELARKRAALCSTAHEHGTARYEDGMARLGASRALKQLAADLEATAAVIDLPIRRRSRRS